jgi:rare lipoprotein A
VANTSYDERLEGDKPVPEKLQVAKNAEPAPSSTVPEPAPEPVRPEPPASKTTAAAKTEPAARPEASPAPSDAAVPAAASSGQWIVQVAALRDRSAAASIVRRLSGKGYPAFVVSPAQSASTRVYKVQVGRYEERRDAEQVARRLKTEEKLSSWISR